MIAIDTNLLLRHLLDDDQVQSTKAHNVFCSDETILITDVVLVETVWTLIGKKYKASRDDIISVVHSLLAEPVIVFENAQVIWEAINDFKKVSSNKVGGKKKFIDFPDALIVNKAKYFANKTDDPLSAIYTFDKAVLKMSGVKSL